MTCYVANFEEMEMKKYWLRLICLIRGHEFKRFVVDECLEFCSRCHEKEILDRTFDDLPTGDYSNESTCDHDWDFFEDDGYKQCVECHLEQSMNEQNYEDCEIERENFEIDQYLST